MATTTVLAEGLYFGEGPRWHDDRLWFSDFYDHSVKSCTESGTVVVEFTTPHQPSGLGWLPDGRMLIVSMEDRRVLRREHDGSLVLHADLSGIATWHCNDMVVDAAGRAYVGNFGFDLDKAFHTRTAEEIWADHETSALALVDPDGSVQVVATDMHFPNGAVITPDDRTLIVAESMGGCLTAFDIDNEGSLRNRRVWAALDGRSADGISLDAEGMIWVANPMTNEVFRVAHGGSVVESVETSQPCYACMLGGTDGRTLFALTAASAAESVAAAAPAGRLETVRVSAPRAGRP
jgi:sugar lactone lactonase YvrE